MQRTHELRRWAPFAGAFFTIIAATLGAHSQTLPAMPPTTAPGQSTPGAPAVVTPPPNPPHRAEVLFANGQLQVRADNSSLNQILRSISHLTGLKITGGVEEQRVFGNYGPGPLSTVLATLIDGTGANIFLLGGSATAPPELILTSRSGGAEPPSPTSPTYAMYDEANDHDAPVAPSAPHTDIVPTQPQTPAISGSGTTSPAVPPAKVPSPAGATTPPAPPSAATHSGNLTPEMVEQELLQMQAQQDLKKKQLDDKTRHQQADQQKKLQNVKPQPPPNQNPPSQPPASSTPQ
jgi:hypothetical protein